MWSWADAETAMNQILTEKAWANPLSASQSQFQSNSELDLGSSLKTKDFLISLISWRVMVPWTFSTHICKLSNKLSKMRNLNILPFMLETCNRAYLSLWLIIDAIDTVVRFEFRMCKRKTSERRLLQYIVSHNGSRRWAGFFTASPLRLYSGSWLPLCLPHLGGSWSWRCILAGQWPRSSPVVFSRK